MNSLHTSITAMLEMKKFYAAIVMKGDELGKFVSFQIIKLLSEEYLFKSLEEQCINVVFQSLILFPVQLKLRHDFVVSFQLILFQRVFSLLARIVFDVFLAHLCRVCVCVYISCFAFLWSSFEAYLACIRIISMLCNYEI